MYTLLEDRHLQKGGNLSNDDGDVNENGKKAIGLDWQNNNFARAAFFYNSLPSLHDYNMKVLNFTFSRMGTQDNNFLFLFVNFETAF